jgi:hypothetical protein
MPVGNMAYLPGETAAAYGWRTSFRIKWQDRSSPIPVPFPVSNNHQSKWMMSLPRKFREPFEDMTNCQLNLSGSNTGIGIVDNKLKEILKMSGSTGLWKS